MAICATCNMRIEGKCICALGKTYHPGHFICTICKQPLTEKILYQREGKPVCEQDFTAACPLCVVCRKPILEDHITVCGQSYHAEHFACDYCEKLIADGRYNCQNNKIICQRCFTNLFSTKCNACGRILVDYSIHALNASWHPECFKCTKCGKPIRTKNYKVDEDSHLICGQCHTEEKLFEYILSAKLFDKNVI